VDRQLKKVVKNDEFKEQVWQGIDFVKHHTDDAKKYGAIALAVLLVAGGTYWFIHHQTDVREEALAEALKIDDATVGPNLQQANLHYATQAEKDAATQKAFGEVAAKYHGTIEGAIAEMNLGQEAVDRGDLPAAEKHLKDVVDSAPAAYASQSALTLAQLYRDEGKTADAEKILDNLIKNPTITVSKEEAQLALAKVKAKTDPDGARKILESLRTERSAISKAAMNALGELASPTN
jgi:predicted negative regulator of RcsB-dependent stress response